MASGVIPFDDIVPGASVRVAVINSIQYLSVRDVIMHVCDKNENYATEVWRNLPGHEKNEIEDNVVKFQFPGRGQSLQPVITFPGAIKLSMFLPGEKAKSNRCKIVSILVRYFAGDPSLLGEIQANAASNHSVAQMARDSIVNDPQESIKRKRSEDLDILEYQSRVTELHTKKLNNVSLFASTMAMINPDWRDDVRLRLQAEDWLKNVAFNSSITSSNPNSLSIEAPPSASALPSLSSQQSVSISEVANELGVRLNHSDNVKIGAEVRRAYFERHGKKPSKHRQWVDGAERLVNSYTAEDRDLIEDAIRAQKGM